MFLFCTRRQKVDDLNELRREVCRALKLDPDGIYTRQQAALVLCDVSAKPGEPVDASSIDRWRKEGLLDYLQWGKRGVRFFGHQLADFVLNGRRSAKWAGGEAIKSTRLENGGSAGSTAVPSGTAVASMGARSSAYRLAKQTLNAPSKR